MKGRAWPYLALAALAGRLAGAAVIGKATLPSGQVVELKDDHTWSYAGKESAQALEFRHAGEAVQAEGAVTLGELEGDPARRTLRLDLSLRNLTTKRVVGLVLDLKMLTPLDKGYGFKAREEIALEPGEILANALHYEWEDLSTAAKKPKGKADVFSILGKSAANGAVRTVLRVERVVFDDGSILASRTPATKPKRGRR